MSQAPWYVAGPALGLLIVALRWTVNRPFGVLGGYVELGDYPFQRRRLGHYTFLLTGMILGGALYAVSSGTFALTPVYPLALGGDATSQTIILLIAGILMGFGARAAGGCTSGHGLTGISLGSPASIAAMMIFFVVAMSAARIFALLR